MARLSRTTKEVIKTVLFFLILSLIFLAYVVYPLNRTKVLMARGDSENFSDTSFVMNDPSFFTEAGLMVDTFRFEPDGLANLACLFIPAADSLTAPTGTIFIIPSETESRDSVAALAAAFHREGYALYTYDQRATGKSTGNYRGDGTHEASDIEQLISHLEIHNQLVHPLCIVGFQLGADAAVLAALEEKRIDAIVAVNPYLTTPYMQDVLRKRYDTYWFPFYRTIMWWWYEIRSGYATIYRRLEDIKPVPCRTLVMVPDHRTDSDEINRLRELSDSTLLRISAVPETPGAAAETIISFFR